MKRKRMKQEKKWFLDQAHLHPSTVGDIVWTIYGFYWCIKNKFINRNEKRTAQA